jgi:hypothetical protein
MQQHKNKPEGFKMVRKRIFTKGLPIMLIAVTTGFLISYFTENGAVEDMYANMLFILFIAAVIAFSFWRTLQKQKIVYDSYLLTVGDDYLLKEQSTLKATRLSFDEIERIEKDGYGNLFVYGALQQNIVLVSANIDDYQGVKDLLQSIKPIGIRDSYNLFQKHPLLTLLIPCGLMVAVYLSNNKIVVAAAGISLIAIIIWGFYKIRTNPYFTNRSKRSAWMIPIALISLILLIYYKLFGA